MIVNCQIERLLIVILFIPSTTMRLLAHNMLICNVQKCQQKSFPLTIEITESEIRETEFNLSSIKRLIKKLDWPSLHKTVIGLGQTDFPKNPTDQVESEEFLRKLHRLILEIHVLRGVLRCPNCKKEYQIVNGIPNMILHDSQII